MDMAAKFQDQTLFHMTGKRAGEGLAPLTADFRPALLARYRDLARLRYDYPVLLLDRDDGSEYVESLSGLVDGLIAEIISYPFSPTDPEADSVMTYLRNKWGTA